MLHQCGPPHGCPVSTCTPTVVTLPKRYNNEAGKLCGHSTGQSRPKKPKWCYIGSRHLSQNNIVIRNHQCKPKPSKSWCTYINIYIYIYMEVSWKGGYPQTIHLIRVSIKITSSTAQGGWRKFQNRKPIGDVGCCESRMAERIHWLTERWLELCLLEWLQWLQWSPHPQVLDVLWCTATVVVVVASWSCSCGVM